MDWHVHIPHKNNRNNNNNSNSNDLLQSIQQSEVLHLQYLHYKSNLKKTQSVIDKLKNKITIVFAA